MNKVKLFSGDSYINLEDKVNKFLEGGVDLVKIEFSTSCKDNTFKDVIYSVLIHYVED